MDRNPSLALAWALAIAAHIAWGYLAPGGKILLEWWPHWSLNAVRMGVATLVLMAVYGRQETVYALKALMVDKNLAILGVVGVGFTFSLFLASLHYLEATVAALLVFLAPFITAVIARLTIREPVGWHLPVAGFLLLGGAYLAVFGREPLLAQLATTGVAFGLALNLGSVLSWSIYTVHVRAVAPRYPLSRILIAMFTAATIFFLLAALFFEAGAVQWSVVLTPLPLFHLGLYIIFPGLLAYLLHTTAIARVGAGPISILLGVELIVASILAHLLLFEAFPPERIVGLGIAAVAVTWFVYRQNRFELRMRRQGRKGLPGQPV